MTARDVSHYLKVNEKKVYRLIRATDIPHMWIGGTLTFARELIDKWIVEKTGRDKRQTVEDCEAKLIGKAVVRSTR